jgi:hypothetical protein
MSRMWIGMSAAALAVLTATGPACARGGGGGSGGHKANGSLDAGVHFKYDLKAQKEGLVAKPKPSKTHIKDITVKKQINTASPGM